jgi:hypothetical protein
MARHRVAKRRLVEHAVPARVHATGIFGLEYVLRGFPDEAAAEAITHSTTDNPIGQATIRVTLNDKDRPQGPWHLHGIQFDEVRGPPVTAHPEPEREKPSQQRRRVGRWKIQGHITDGRIYHDLAPPLQLIIGLLGRNNLAPPHTPPPRKTPLHSQAWHQAAVGPSPFQFT